MQAREAAQRRSGSLHDSHSFGRSWPGAPTDWDRRPATVAQLLAALGRIQGEAASLSDRACTAIQHHAFDPYRNFCEKRSEHAALAAILRDRARGGNAECVAAVTQAERAFLALSIEACVKFCFALSATPLLPVGVRETFQAERAMLEAARRNLSETPEGEGVAALLGEIDTASMILDEIVDRAPALAEL